MPFANSPFQLTPVRTNELKQVQLNKEIHSLESNISRLESEISEIKTFVCDIAPVPIPKIVSEKGTSKYYKTNDLPNRFEHPETWKYNVKKQHKSYTTTTNSYGIHTPTVHDMPTTFKGLSSHFSSQLDRAGPYRNFSLNI